MFIDIIAIILLIYGFYSGYSRGIIDTIFDILSIFIAVLAALKLSPLVIRFIETSFSLSQVVSFVVGFVLTFFIVMLGIRLLANQLENFMKAIHLNFINKFAGGALSALIMVTMFSGALYLSNELTLLPEHVKSESTTYPVIEQIPQLMLGIFSGLKPLFIDFWDLLKETIDTIKVKGESMQ